MSAAPPELQDVVDMLDRFHQRATYGAVGGVVNRPPLFLMQGCDRSHRHSWIVSSKTRLPTNYTSEDMHPCIRERDHVIASAAELEEWLRAPT